MVSKKFLTPIIGLALLTKNTSDFCVPNLNVDPRAHITRPQRPTLPCTINLVKPDFPEMPSSDFKFPLVSHSITVSGMTLSQIHANSLTQLK